MRTLATQFATVKGTRVDIAGGDWDVAYGVDFRAAGSAASQPVSLFFELTEDDRLGRRVATSPGRKQVTTAPARRLRLGGAAPRFDKAPDGRRGRGAVTPERRRDPSRMVDVSVLINLPSRAKVPATDSP